MKEICLITSVILPFSLAVDEYLLSIHHISGSMIGAGNIAMPRTGFLLHSWSLRVRRTHYEQLQVWWLPSGKCVHKDLIWPPKTSLKIEFYRWSKKKMKHGSLRRKERTFQHSTWDRREIFLFQIHRKVQCNSIK